MSWKAQKLRDFCDLFLLDINGLKVEEFKNEIVRKTRTALYYKKYRDNLEANKMAMKVDADILENPHERELFVASPPRILEDS